MKFYGLFYIDDDLNKKQSSNLNHSGSINIYLNNAYYLAKNLFDINGIKLNLLTNNKDLIKKIVPDIDKYCNLLEISFFTNVPKNARFYSAHFKLDVFRYLSNLEKNEYVGLIDLDVICINKFSDSFIDLFNNRIPIVYDITNQRVDAYGENKIIEDLSYVLGEKSLGRWYGGEFIFGSPDFFKKLVDHINEVYLNYCNNLNKLSHHGDEVIVSAAIEKMIKKGENIKLVNDLLIIERYWSKIPRHKQNRFKYVEKSSLLHLPADKKFISDNRNLEVEKFLKKYKKYRFYRKFKGLVGDLIKKVNF